MRKRTTILARTMLAALALAGGGALAQGAETLLWEDASESEVRFLAGERTIRPSAARLVHLDAALLEELLAHAPSELVAPQGLAGVELTIPDLAGGMLRFRVVDSPVMAPELAARYPAIRTFRLIGADGAAINGRADWTPQGFHAMVRTAEGTLLVDPLVRGETTYYQVYRKSDLVRPEGVTWTCGVRSSETTPGLRPAEPASPDAAGPNLRTYRLALATTGEYSVAVCGAGPGKPCVLAALVTAMNRINQVYEDEVAIRMILVANNDLVIYLDGATDPYTNNNGVTMLGQNQTTINNVIGSANYDIGHVFSTGGGGVATLRGPCGSSKARGVTGLPSPVGDPFYIDFVAHEMGHQWGGNHTFNGSSSNCSGGNRNASTAYEPGSGSTIMAYAGICPPQDLQSNSDAYFHAVSLDEIVAFSRTSTGNNCAVPVTATNDLPTVSAGPDYTIPYGTPFALAGAGSDLNGDPITYDWEEWDLGAAGAPTSPVGDAPIFRSFNPTTSPTRTFPKVSDLVNNTATIGEILPASGRPQLDFRLTVRDGSNPAGAFASDFMAITVAAAGPFLVTDPNTAITWNGAGPHSVSWNVAGTDTAPVSCAAVDLFLSTDGGFTFPLTLLAATPNDGSATVPVNVPDTTSARIKIACNGNIFFDLSNANFSIVDAVLFVSGFESGDLTGWVL